MAELRKTGIATRIEQNKGLVEAQRTFSARAQSVEEFKKSKLSEGYKQEGNTFTKTVGSTTTTSVVDPRTLEVVTTTTTKRAPIRRATSQLEAVLKEIRKTEYALKLAEKQGSEGAKSIRRYLNALYDKKDQIENTGTAYYFEEQAPEVQTGKDIIITDSGFQSKAFELQTPQEQLRTKTFFNTVQSKFEPAEEQLKTSTTTQRIVQSFTAPRVINPKETKTIQEGDTSLFNPTLSSMDRVQTREYEAFKGLQETYDEQIKGDNGLKTLGTGYKLLGLGAFQTLSNPLGVIEGTGKGIITPYIDVAESIGTMKPTLKRTTAMTREMTQGFIQSPPYAIGGILAQSVILAPVGFAGERFLTTKAPTIIDAINVNKFTRTGIKEGVRTRTPSLLTSGERARTYVEANPTKILTNTEFTPIEQLTVPISEFNQRQRYFSKPNIDVQKSREFNIAGLERLPPENPKGVLPLVEKEFFDTQPTQSTLTKNVVFFERANPLSTEVTSRTGKIINEGDIPFSENPKYFESQRVKITEINKDTQTGLEKFGFETPVKELIKEEPKTSTAFTTETKTSVKEQKTVIDNSEKFNFETKPEKPSSVGRNDKISSAYANDGGVTTFKVSNALFDEEIGIGQGGRRKLVLEPEYKYDVETDSYVRKVGGVELNKDIKYKITPSKFGVLTGRPIQNQVSVIQPAIKEQPLQINIQKNKVAQIKNIGEFIGLKQEDILKSKTNIKIDLKQEIKQLQGLEQLQTQKTVLQTTQTRIQRAPERAFRSAPKEPQAERLRFKPAFPKASTVPTQIGGFTVLGRRQGQFKVLGTFGDLSTAFNRGKQFVETTAGASFKIRSAFGESVKPAIAGNKNLSYSKRESSVIVQKREFRISSAGEKQEISAKGRRIKMFGSKRQKKKNIFQR